MNHLKLISIWYIYIYIHELKLNKNIYLFRDENIKKIATDFEQYKKFENIHRWYLKINKKYKQDDPIIFKSVVNVKNGWYSSHRNYYENMIIISSYILTYKIYNDIFNCKEDKEYFKVKRWTQKGLNKILKHYSRDSYQRRVTRKMYYYFLVTRTNLKNQPTPYS